MTVSALLGGEAAPLTIEFKGKTYAFGLIHQKAKTAWEQSVKAEAAAELQAIVKGFPAAVQAAAASDLAGRMASYEYAFFGPRSMAGLQTADGMAKMASILAGCTLDEAVAVMEAVPVQFRAVMESIYADSFGAMIEMGQAAQQQAGTP